MPIKISALTANVFLQTQIIGRANPNDNWAHLQITVPCMAAHNQQQPQHCEILTTGITEQAH